MGLVYANILLSNAVDSNLGSVETKALVDTGSLHLCIPEHIALQLKLKELEKREVILADGKRQLCAYCGPIKIVYQNRSCYTGALILGNEVLLGTIPLEDMDLVVIPSLLQFSPNPKNPNIPVSVAK